MAKCRRNVENFLDACKKMGVPQVSLDKLPFLTHAFFFFLLSNVLSNTAKMSISCVLIIAPFLGQDKHLDVT